MGRWEPGARERLREAALELYVEHGYEQVTVAGIARRAGLTERTFFRHFTDKREVLFQGSGDLQDLFTAAVTDAPPAATPLQAVGAALDAVGAAFDGRREAARQRQAVIAAVPDLRERELIKLSALSAAVAAALRDRGVPALAAALTAQAGVAVFAVSFDRWVADGDGDTGAATLTELVHGALAELTALFRADPVSAGPPSAGPPSTGPVSAGPVSAAGPGRRRPPARPRR